MAPKKKKTKEQLEAERLKLEEEARIAEEERLKAEELQQQAEAQAALRKQQLEQQNLEKEAERLEKQRAAAAPLLAAWAATAAEQRRAADEAEAWQRYLACSHLPDPRVASCMNDFLNACDGARPIASVRDALVRMEDNLAVIREIDTITLRASQCQDADQLERMEAYRLRLFALIDRDMDAMTAWVMHHQDYFAKDERENVQLEELSRNFEWGIWLNVNKNPRLKAVNFAAVGVQLDIPKQVALAAVAVRAQLRHATDEFRNRCTNEFVPLGPVLLMDMLALPPPCRFSANEWVLRLEGPLSHSLHRVPYPIPPAGADPSWRSEEEVVPLGLHVPLPPNVVPLAGAEVQVGAWDDAEQAWTLAPVSDVAELSDGTLSFKTTTLAPFAVVRSRCAHLPYRSWSIRPSRGDRGNAAMVAVALGADGGSVEFEVLPNEVYLRSPRLPQLAGIVDQGMAPDKLLLALAARGMFLMPEDRDAAATGVQPKDVPVELAMCTDVASLSGTHLISSSKWTQHVSSEECICRASEVTDWEVGGRTSAADAQRIFEREKAAGARKVVAIIRRGRKGVAYSAALDSCATYPALPPYDDERCSQCIWGQIHADAVSLIRADFGVEPVDEVTIDAEFRAQEEVKQKSAESKRKAELEEYAKKGEKAPEELQQPYQIQWPERPLYWPTDWGNLAAALQPHAGTVERAEDLDPMMIQTLARLLHKLRLFSFTQ